MKNKLEIVDGQWADGQRDETLIDIRISGKLYISRNNKGEYKVDYVGMKVVKN